MHLACTPGRHACSTPHCHSPKNAATRSQTAECKLRLSSLVGENEANVHFVLKTFDNMRLVSQQPYLASHGLTGQYSHDDGHREEWLTPEQASLVQRFYPCSEADTIGFFIAKFCKAS